MPCGRLVRIERGEAERLPPEEEEEGEEGRKRDGSGKGWSGERIGRVGDSRRVAGDVGEEEEILRLAARGYWKEARRDERRS